jgi:hypothetical protein
VLELQSEMQMTGTCPSAADPSEGPGTYSERCDEGAAQSRSHVRRVAPSLIN